MRKRIEMNVTLKKQDFSISLDPVSRKNLNIRVKPNNIINVSKPAFFSKRKLIAYLEEHDEWIVSQAERVNELSEARSSFVNQQSVILFGEEVQLSDRPDLENNLDKILLDYIISKREVYDMLLDKKPLINVKKMKGKWGYCVPAKNQLFFNSKLVHYPKEVIDYVILHEYAHLKIPNHSRSFYTFIENEMPDYKSHIKYLREH